MSYNELKMIRYIVEVELVGLNTPVNVLHTTVTLSIGNVAVAGNTQCTSLIKILTRSGVMGARMEPILPIIEQKPSRLWRALVGNSSEV